MSSSETKRLRYWRLKNAGICVTCGRLKARKCDRCRPCYASLAAAISRRRARLKAEGRCIECGKKTGGGVRCSRHAAINRERWHEWATA